ncbi:MAG: metallophosphoesterase [Spirochaetia bacterium]|nr:metallophosphoesterase [Spirochaetia bacterium]
MNARDATIRAFRRPEPPPEGEYASLADAAVDVLSSEPPDLRPQDIRGLPGGLIRLDTGLPTIVVPDLHARRDFFISLMESPLPEGGTVRDALAVGALQILCLGDGFHAESRALDRWQEAYLEFLGGWRKRDAMDQEMAESMGLMEMVMLAKLAYPGHFHFLKGNHENVLNEEGDGNHPFRKFVLEGEMVRSYLERFYGDDFLERYAAFEKALPLFAVGARFLASHAEPERPYSDAELVNARLSNEVILGLTWTDNGAAEPGSVTSLLSRMLPDVKRPRYFTGHRVISGLYRERSSGYHLQIHNPGKFVVAWALPDRDFKPERDIGELRDLSGELSEPR